MKKVFVLFLALTLTALGANAACAAVQARDALIAYTGTDAFTKLTTSERRYCLEWLVEGGTMRTECKRAIVRLIAIAPSAISEEQRQALISAVSDAPAASTVSNASTPVIVEKNDEAAAAIVGGLVGLVAGLVIGNNSGRHHYAPAPYRPPPPGIDHGPPGRGPIGPGRGGPPRR